MQLSCICHCAVFFTFFLLKKNPAFPTTEICADKYKISRKEQDDHAIESGTRATAAAAKGLLASEIAAVPGPPVRKGDPVQVDADEALIKFDPEKLVLLRPCFRKNGGTVTAGNASPISDGAAAVVLASSAAVQKHGAKAIGRVAGYADGAHDPVHFPTAPAIAIRRAIQDAGLEPKDIDFYEINEAFSVVDLANRKLLKLNPDR